jgi:CBS domain-containing protein
VVWAILIPLLVVGLAAGLIPVVMGMLHDHRARREGGKRFTHRFVQPRRPEGPVDEAVALPATTSAAVAAAVMREEGARTAVVEGHDEEPIAVVTAEEISRRVEEDPRPPENVPLGSVAVPSAAEPSSEG